MRPVSTALDHQRDLRASLGRLICAVLTFFKTHVGFPSILFPLYRRNLSSGHHLSPPRTMTFLAYTYILLATLPLETSFAHIV